MTRHSPRTAIITTLSVLMLALLALIPLAPAANAASNFAWSRYAGSNRFDTARLIAIDTFGTSQTVVIATGVTFPDALAGSYIAGSSGTGAPILLVLPDAVPNETDAAINALGATRAVILGGPNAVSANVENRLKAKGMTTERIQGNTRYDTAQAAAEKFGAANVGTVDNDKTALVSLGRDYPDALAGGPLSYSGKLPMILTEPDQLPQQARSALTNLAIKRVLLLGGPNAVSTNVENQIKAMNITVVRLSGTTRQGTATAIADLAKAKLGFVAVHVGLARGNDFADALTFGPHAGKEKTPILLTGDPNTLTTTTRDYIASNCSGLTSGHIAGGTAAVSTGVEQEAADAALCDRATVSVGSTNVQAGGQITGTITGSGIQGVSVSGCGLNQAVTRDAQGAFSLTVPANQPSGQCTLTFATTFTDSRSEVDSVVITVTGTQPTGYSVTPVAAATQTNNTTRDFTASNLGTNPVDIALFRCEAITTDANGNPVFTQSPSGSGTATQGAPASTITVVNGANNPATSAGNGGTVINNVTPQSGQVTFTIKGPATTASQGECVVPVVFRDANSNNTLDVGASTGAPTETFAQGGATTFLPTEAAAGSFNASDVKFMDKTGNQFSACLITGPSTGSNSTAEPGTVCASYFYDSNDTYQVGGASVGQAAFEAALSPNDNVEGTYAIDPSGVSNFELTDQAPLPPTGVTATGGTSGATLTVQWTDSLTPSVDSYNVYRLQAVNTTTACPDVASPTGLTTAETPTRDYAKVATVRDKSGTAGNDGTYTYVDTGLTASQRYCYILRALDNGDESINSDTNAVVPNTQAAQANTGTAPSNPGAPTITDVRAEDGGLSGVLDAGDVHQFIFSEPMNPTVAASGSTYRVTDGDDPSATIVDVVCGTSGNASCFLDPRGTYNGTLYPANQVMRVRITTKPAGAQLVQAGSATDLQYPGTITSIQTTTFKDADEGRTLDLVASADKVINATSGNAAISPAPTTTAPTVTTQSGTTASGVSTLITNWSKTIVGLNAGGFTVHAPADGTCAGPAVATGSGFTGNDDGDSRLDTTLSNPLAPGNYFYTVAAGSVRDIDGNLNGLVPCTAVSFA